MNGGGSYGSDWGLYSRQAESDALNLADYGSWLATGEQFRPWEKRAFATATVCLHPEADIDEAIEFATSVLHDIWWW